MDQNRSDIFCTYVKKYDIFLSIRDECVFCMCYPFDNPVFCNPYRLKLFAFFWNPDFIRFILLHYKQQSEDFNLKAVAPLLMNPARFSLKDH